MPAQERLDYWRNERDRLERELASDPDDRRRLADVLTGDLERAEVFIRFYEDSLAEQNAKRP